MSNVQVFGTIFLNISLIFLLSLIFPLGGKFIMQLSYDEGIPKFEISKKVNLVQFANILSICKSVVVKLDKSNDVNDIQSLNISIVFEIL